MVWANLLILASKSRSGKHTGSGKEGVAGKLFWAYHQAFFLQLLTALKAPSVINIVTEALSEQQSVIVSIQKTGDSRTKDRMDALTRKAQGQNEVRGSQSHAQMQAQVLEMRFIE